MDIAGKIIVVTGAASGIGEGLSRRFAQEGAKGVVVSDINQEGIDRVADDIGGLAVKCDVAEEAEIINLVKQTEQKFGPIDLFCSNAGITVSGGVEANNETWQLAWQVHVMAHMYAARAVIPGMIERGDGWLLNTASGAGLLSQIGSSPYSTTKHAAIGLAESLAITYGHQGIGVSVLCPGAIRTEMTKHGAGGAEADGWLEPEDVADITVKALAEEKFMIMTHEVLQTHFNRKASDYDRWIRGMKRYYAMNFEMIEKLKSKT